MGMEKGLSTFFAPEEGTSIHARGRFAFARHQQLRSIVLALKGRRLSQSMSLAAVARATGIAKTNLMEENGLIPFSVEGKMYLYPFSDSVYREI
jgi:hypothetical protein